MAVLDVALTAGTDDADINQSGTSFNNSSGFTNMRQAASTSISTAVGWRFQIPTAISSSDITDVRLVLQLGNTSGLTGSVAVERTVAATWATGSPNSPINRYNSAISGGSTGQTWSIAASTTDGGSTISPNLWTTDMQTAWAAGTAGTDYIGICLKMGSTGGTVYSNAVSQNSGVPGLRPVLRITHTVARSSAVTTSGLSYAMDGPGNKYMDIMLPATAPTGKLLIYLHGGAFQSTNNYRTDVIPTSLKNAAFALGYDIINAEYSLSTANVFTQVGNSFPQPLHDIKDLLRWCERWKGSYGWDMSKVVFAGHSSGGHVALFTLLSLADTTNYSGYQNVASNRKKAGTETRPTFDLDGNVGAVSFTPKGIMLFAAPLNLYQASQQSAPSGPILATARNTYMGETLLTPPPQAKDELDLDLYIAGTSTVYGATTHKPTFPIGYVEVLSDDTVFPAAGATALYNALGTSGFSYDRPSVGVVTATGLSRWQITATHVTAASDQESVDAFTAWDKVLFPSDTSSMFMMF